MNSSGEVYFKPMPEDFNPAALGVLPVYLLHTMELLYIPVEQKTLFLKDQLTDSSQAPIYKEFQRFCCGVFCVVFDFSSF